MNWLAHLYLSAPFPASRLGSLLPDLMAPADLAAMPPSFQQEIRRHRLIDAFTDSHPIVRESRQRFDPNYRRYSGILIDVFYDHFLARDWDRFSSVPLRQFTAEVYAAFDDCRADVPSEMRTRLARMKNDDWLCSYETISGVALAIGRIGSRFRRPCDLTPTVKTLELEYDAFRTDFHQFFPELVQHVSDIK